MKKIHIETFGKGKPIVLVHGWAMHTGIWRDFAVALSKSYRVICVDLPGHGQSEAVADFSLETVAKILTDTIDEETSCWLGWSMGAEIVLEVARNYPNRVDKIILLAGSPCFIKKDSWSGVDERVLDEFALSLKSDAEPALSRFLAWQVQGLTAWKRYLDKLTVKLFEYGFPDLNTLLSGLTLLKKMDLRKEFAELKIPIAIILGEKDTLIPRVVGSELQALNPQLELTVINKAGHAPFLSHQDEVVNVVSDFMERHAAG